MRAPVLVYLIATRLAEVVLSRVNAKRLGARPVDGDGMRAITAVHLLWMAGLAFEPSHFEPVMPLLVIFAFSEVARFWCMATLGTRWNIRVIAANTTPIRRGPYRFLRHPNYLAVVVGMVALPLGLGLVLTPLVVLPLKLAALRRRVRVENLVLAARHGSTANRSSSLPRDIARGG